MRSIRLIFFIGVNLLFFFVIANLAISIYWEYKTIKKFEKFNPYLELSREALGLNLDEARQLYIETWIDRKYQYDQFVEWNEGEQTNKKFVNISQDGRKISNNNDCKKNFYFYGGSTTFGYNVADNQTFAQYFKNILDKEFPNQNFCVFNHGRAGYASPWETFLFQKHLNQKKIGENDFVFFIDGVNERGISDGLNTESIKNFINALSYDYWDIYKPISSLFIQSLPYSQLVLRLKQKKRLGSKDLDSIKCPTNTRTVPINSKLTCLSVEEVSKTLENFIRIRNSTCKEFKINCYTMLQPFSTIHGKYFPEYEKSAAIETGILKDRDQEYEKTIEFYESFAKIKGIVDISGALDSAKTLSYIDRSHYSPAANKSIANKIFSHIKDKIYEQ